MSRLTIDLPDKFVFQTALPVRVSDLNYSGHVGNDNILTLMQEARTLFYRSLGFESEIELDGPIGQVIADAAVIYKSESFLGDVLTIAIAVADISKYSFDLYYKIQNQATGKDIAYGKTGVVCFDSVKRKVAGIPPTLLMELQRML